MGKGNNYQWKKAELRFGDMI